MPGVKGPQSTAELVPIELRVGDVYQNDKGEYIRLKGAVSNGTAENLEQWRFYDHCGMFYDSLGKSYYSHIVSGPMLLTNKELVVSNKVWMDEALPSYEDADMVFDPEFHSPEVGSEYFNRMGYVVRIVDKDPFLRDFVVKDQYGASYNKDGKICYTSGEPKENGPSMFDIALHKPRDKFTSQDLTDATARLIAIAKDLGFKASVTLGDL